ncbi:hypothetical protein [Okeania sp. SIO3I5]|uniref:hypothetical protein n=1 Tax=Okeania sp. SIO3I5 TaxID=2607805 RepID=UPI0025EC03DB|nr:hypothetical protein [Okeania sp. SIO3I5]
MRYISRSDTSLPASTGTVGSKTSTGIHGQVDVEDLRSRSVALAVSQVYRSLLLYCLDNHRL